jgi:hypothetical protein
MESRCMSVSERQQKWRIAAAANPRGFVQSKIRIPDLMGREVPFIYNHDQILVSEKKKELHKQGKPVRLWILKARRAGISLLESVENYAYAYGNNNARCGVLAHLEDRAKEILQNFRVFDDSLKRFHPDLVQDKSKDSVFGLKFARSNSQILIATAENPIKVRGDGLHRLQITEGAHFYNKFHNVMKEVGPVVPALRGSQIVIETTGSLIGSEPYEHWFEADQGRNEYIAMFLCWLDDPARAIPFENERHKHEIFEKIAHYEPRLAELNKFYKLTPEQIHASWLMFHLQAENDFNYFCREWPYSKEMAWSAGGDSYFGNYEIAKARPEKPIGIYEFDNTRRIFKDPGDLRRIEKADDYSILPNLKIWALPKKGARYIIGSDSSYGDAGSDYSAGYLIDMTNREMMASYHGLLRPDEAAHIIVSLCRLYNNALAAPETNPAGGGYEALNCIQRLGYHNIYSWRRRDGNKGIESARAIGWWTNSWSRPLMLGELRKIFIDCVRDRVPDAGMFRDEPLIREMRTFGMRPDGTPGANANCKDDRVIACAIAHQAANDETYCTKDDLLLQYSKSTMPKPTADEDLLIKRDPNKVIQQMMSPNSNFNRNRFEI